MCGLNLLGEALGNDRVNNRLNSRSPEHLFRLALKLRLRYSHSNDRGKTGDSVILLNFVFPQLQPASVFINLSTNRLDEPGVKTGLVGATLLGTVVGVASFSRNGLLRRLARVYVEIVRNIPLLLQLVFWYFVVFLALPNGTAALQLPGVVLAKSGLYLAGFGEGLRWAGPQLVNGVWQAPLRITVEFAALLTALVIYSGAFIAEVVRGGVAAVPRGQWEAASSLGLHWFGTLRHIVLPQALRVIVPGLNTQYISLAKNSSLAVAVGYTDLYSVAETTLNQTGRAVEVVLLLLGAYLTIDLLISALMNGLDRLVQIRER